MMELDATLIEFARTLTGAIDMGYVPSTIAALDLSRAADKAQFAKFNDIPAQLSERLAKD